MKNLIVFDWNGTLLSDTRAAWSAGNECLKFYDAAPISLQHYRETFHFPVIHFYTLNGLSVDQILAKKDEGNAVFNKAYEPLAATARTRKGTRQLLDWLHTQDINCMILSNYRTEKIAQHLERLKIGHYFDHISAHDCDGTTILQSTTKTERLKAYMDDHGYTAKDTLIIGDSTEEPEIGRLLGITSVGITDGCISEKRLRAAKPDHVITHLGALKDLI